jgi:hypothetical protein
MNCVHNNAPAVELTAAGAFRKGCLSLLTASRPTGRLRGLGQFDRLRRSGAHEATETFDQRFAHGQRNLAQFLDEVAFPLFGEGEAMALFDLRGIRLFADQQQAEQTQRNGAGTDRRIVAHDLAERAGRHAKLARGFRLRPTGFGEQFTKLLFWIYLTWCFHIFKSLHI